MDAEKKQISKADAVKAIFEKGTPGNNLEEPMWSSDVYVDGNQLVQNREFKRILYFLHIRVKEFLCIII